MWRRLRYRVGRRGAALLFFAFLDLVYGASFFAPPRSARSAPALMWIAAVLPLWAWGLIWTGVGLLLLVYAFRTKDAVAWAVAMALKVVFGLLFVAGQVLADLERGYVSAAVWLALAALVWLLSGWPEPDRIHT